VPNCPASAAIWSPDAPNSIVTRHASDPGGAGLCGEERCLATGGAYSASDRDGILGKVDLSTGLVSPIVTGMKFSHRALFIFARCGRISW
jgi:hypothetical protein